MGSNFISLDKDKYYSLQKELLELRQELDSLHKIHSKLGLDKGEELKNLNNLSENCGKASENQFRHMQLLVEQMSIPIAMFDCNMKCLITSGSWLQGSNIQSQNRDVFLSIYESCLQEFTKISESTSFIDNNGITCSCTWEANPWYDNFGRRGGVIISYRINDFAKTSISPISDTSGINLSNQKLQNRVQELEQNLKLFRKEQIQLIQTEKMNALSQIVAGFAHEINNPISFLHGNITPTVKYIQDILELVELYKHYYPQPEAEIAERIADIDLEFIRHDLNKILLSMEVGTERIQGIVLSLKSFSRLNESELKKVDIHEGIDSTLTILRHRLKATEKRPEILAIADYGDLPDIECYPSQLNQVFMNIIGNAIDAFNDDNRDADEARVILISSELINSNWATVRIQDNGCGIPKNIQNKLFEPFFTTKEIGQGMGIGLSTSYQIIVKNHGGKIEFNSILGQGSQFIISIPISRK